MQIFSGIDSVEIDRIKKSIQNKKFLERFFSQKEITLFEKRGFSPQTIAANFCVKEAFSKALGTGICGFSLKEVSALRNELGAPYLELDGKAKELAKNLAFSVSITHTDKYATAVVIACKE